jgi:hypothetical protein
VVAEADDPCWKNYKQIGMKEKNGKQVPNCVPEDAQLEAAFEDLMGQFAENAVDRENKTPKYAGKISAVAHNDEREYGDNSNKISAALDKAEKKKVSLPKTPWNEEAEALDELSPELLGRYAYRATKDASANLKKIAGAKDRYTGRTFQGRANKREKGADMAIDKIRGNYNAKVHAKDKVEAFDEAVAKIACVKCDEVSTAAAWNKNHDTCPKCKTSKQGVAEDAIKEAYINTGKDAIQVLANLRKIGKSIELGQGSYEGNLANEYAEDVWDVYSFIEAKTKGFQGVDSNAKAVINAMMSLRSEAKKLETQPGSGSNAGFANSIVNTLYPVIQYLQMADIDRTKENDEDVLDNPEGTPPQTPIGEYILSYFDREQGKFPKGETAVLTAVQKEYGDMHVKPAAKFMKKVEAMVAQRKIKEIADSRYPETEMIKKLAGVN